MAEAVAATASAVVSAPAIPFKQDTPLGAAPLGGGAVAVLLLSLLVIVAVLFLRRRLPQAGGGSGGRLLRVLERQPLGPRAQLVVVEFEGQRLLLAHTEHGVAQVAAAAAPAAVAPEAP
ncbi:flagellar biosynthetic protein FliO [Pseudoduganella sp. R-43]|uniref:flagellar biosynthetic protein FliO n=1 Tax=Pseudoduganella sp. R-43 TaxID=3404063 RepID=UPI003CF6EC75